MRPSRDMTGTDKQERKIPGEVHEERTEGEGEAGDLEATKMHQERRQGGPDPSASHRGTCCPLAGSQGNQQTPPREAPRLDIATAK